MCFKKTGRGKYQIDLPKVLDYIEFKFTRGDWSKEEVNIAGYKIGNRSVTFGEGDTLHLDIFNWLDLTDERPLDITFLIDTVPHTTPEDADLFLASSFNWWDARSRKYKFDQFPNGNYYLTIKRADPDFQYKITRGDWDSEEANGFGMARENRNFAYNGEDTVRIQVINWLDLPAIEQDHVVIMLDNVPRNIPQNEKIYITGTFNDWNPGDPNFIMNRNLKGQYYITIPRRADDIQFKFTLGNWEKEELNDFGNTIDNRQFRFGYADTIWLKVDNFEGL